ncbi:MAG TPA: TIM barrel protein, partial [Saprospiraceae bacterium]|nr:TIM barrel protein [Saprospiraceae bacterium]
YMGEDCHSHGIQFGYHNHDFEFRKMEGTATTMYDYILDNTDPKLVKMEMDLYWVRFANEDPIQWINKHPGRFSAFHVKDMADTPARESIEIGDGVIDFSPIFNLKAARSVQYYIVELESYRTTSMDGVNTCLQRLKKIVHQA